MTTPPVPFIEFRDVSKAFGENRVLDHVSFDVLPAETVSPPKRLTPRRCALLSRPLRDEPPAFLCAMARPRFRCSRS